MRRDVLELIEILGTELAMLLANAYAGRELYVPKAIDAEHAIAKLIGLEPARELSAQLGGTKLVMFSRRSADIRQRNKRIFDDVMRGRLHKEVAMDHGIGRVAVTKIVNQLKEETQA